MDKRDGIIEELRALVAKLTAQLEAQSKRIGELELALAKAQKDSSTSSKPPSSDIVNPKPKKNPGQQTKPKLGAQRGHQRHLRQPLPADQVNAIIVHEIPVEEIERVGLKATGEFEIIQHIELPQSPIYVTEHRLMEYLDVQGNRYFPHRPELKGPIFGARMLAMIGWLKSVGHCSYSTIETYLEDVLQVPVSRGYLAKLCTQTISASLATSYEEIKQAIPQQPQLGSDETPEKTLLFQMTLNRDIFLELVRNPPSTKEATNLAARFAIVDYTTDNCQQIQQYDMSQDYFRFMFAQGVEPTNNHSEQQIRYCVIDRRITQGTRGEVGQQYHERMWSAIATCRKQNRSFFDFLHDSIAAKLAHQTAPSLLRGLPT